MSSVCILVADDFVPWRLRVRELLHGRPEWHLEDACDGHEAVQKSADLLPDVVLLDIGIPVLNGIDAAKKIRREAPRSAIIFVTESADEDVKAAVLALGAQGYLSKANAVTELLPAIETVLCNEHQGLRVEESQ